MKKYTFRVSLWTCAKVADKESAAQEELDDKQMAQNRADNVRCLEQCRELLLELDDEEIRRRLLVSRWNTGGKAQHSVHARIEANQTVNDHWLLEACDAFHVPTKYSKHVLGVGGKTVGNRKQGELVEDVLSAVRKARRSFRGNAADRDAKRRCNRLEAMRRNSAALVAARECGMSAPKVVTSVDFRAFKEQVLLRTCPEELRLGVVEEFVVRAGRLPDSSVEAEEIAASYVTSALGRRYVSIESGEQLSRAHANMWEALFTKIPEDTRPAWQEDYVLDKAMEFYNMYRHLEVPKNKDAPIDSRTLAYDLQIVRKALHRDQRSKTGHLLRRQLGSAEIVKWEQAFAGIWRWGETRKRDNYCPGGAVTGNRHEWPREPYFCKPCPCYLCGEDFDSKPQLVQHWREHHLRLPAEIGDTFTATRVEEEIRKLLFELELMEGPFEVRGQEQRRIVGNHATHQTHSKPGTGSLSEDGVPHPKVNRQLSGCAVCARSMWLEDLYDMALFTKPADEDADCDGAVPPADDDDECLHMPPECAHRCRFAVHEKCIHKIDKLLSVESYAQRWPRIPKHELLASSVPHPWWPGGRWLLHTRRIPSMEADAQGNYPLVKVCHDCGSALSKPSPKLIRMPKYALANDNWIGRVPFAFRPDGEPLRDMEVKSLARGRMCVHKVIAEPERRGPHQGRQSGLRGNSIGFPQAKLHLMEGHELPAPPEEAARLLRETLVIAMAGCDVSDLHNAKWAQIRRDPYVAAAKVLVSHGSSYVDMFVNEDRAGKEFAENGRTIDAVMQQERIFY